jgi:hypothetical protein
VELVRDILDKQLIDSHGRAAGKVDGIVLRLRAGKPPLVTAIEVGGWTPARRLPGVIGRWFERAARRWGARGGEPYRIPWGDISHGKMNVRADVDAARTPLLAHERVVRDGVIARLPGSGAP